MDSGLVDCGIEPGQRIWLTLGSADRLSGCKIPEGVVFSFSYSEDSPMDPVVISPPAHQAVDAMPVASPAPHTEAPTVELPVDLTEATGLPDSPDLAQLQGLAGGNPMLMVILAVVVVVGGSTGWKFWSKLSEQKHEQKMKVLELEAQKAGLGGAQPPPCAVKQAEIDAKFMSLEGRLKAAEKAALGLPSDFDAEGLEKLVKKHEKDIVALKKSTAGKT